MKILTETDFLSSKWSGGTSTQLFISPEGASLAERNFDWRISSAVVEIEVSDFSPFEGYERILIPLKGQLKMEHQTPNGVIHQNVNEFQLARFSGSWPTKGTGKLTDFNVIFRPNYHPKVHVIDFPEETLSTLGETMGVVFLQEGSCRIKDQLFHAPVLLVNDQHEALEIRYSAYSRIISVEMDLVG
ncbi:HutD family protein [Fluviicola sp.]|uniref:HutD/Ves family protein n=1 Tax=Fluviicola sp. TaxID=1917219 RepID=UPI0031E3C6DF